VGTLRSLIREEIDRVSSLETENFNPRSNLEHERVSSYVDPISGKIVTHVEFTDTGETEVGHHASQEESDLWSFSIVDKKRRKKFSRVK
jgi:hypothetical protein